MVEAIQEVEKGCVVLGSFSDYADKSDTKFENKVQVTYSEKISSIIVRVSMGA